MSNERLQGRAREKKREIIQRSFRQGWQWVERQLDDIRSKSAPPPPTRRLNPQPTGGSSLTSRRNAVYGLDLSIPPGEWVAPHGPMGQEIFCSSTSLSLWNVSSLSIEHSIQDDHTTPSREVYPNRAQHEFAKSPPPNTLPQGHVHQDSSQASSYGPVNTIQGTVIGNVFMGVNKGTFNMNADNNDFARSYSHQLKISIKADHMYFAEDDETALHRHYCTPGTRINILQGVMHWATNISPNSEIVYWLSGQAGAGKTTIAYTVAHQFETLVIDGKSKVMLGGSFFCSRQFIDTRSASSIVRTIVFQLALRSTPFQTALKEHGRFETVNHGPRSQLMGLLIVPWEKSAPERLARNEPCYIIPIDALDELGGKGGTEFLGALFDAVEQQDLSGLKFFVTSRSEPTLVNRITSFPNKRVCRLEEVPLEESSADIKVYLKANLTQCATRRQIKQLVSDAAGLFIYAATVVEYVKGRDLEEQKSLLKRLLAPPSSSVPRPSRAATARLDNLYFQILDTCLVDPREHKDPEVFRDCLSILHTFLCTIERTSIVVAIDILNASVNDGGTALDAGMATGVLHRLHAVLHSQGGLVMTYHKSFADFLFDECRSGRFFCNQEQHHHHLADGCFRIMAEQLRFNIANIPSSYHMDRDILTLTTSIDTNISVLLRYVCGNWSAHLTLTGLGALDRLAAAVHKFLQLQVLFWMESMNLLGLRGRCQSMLRNTQHWFSKSKDAAELVSELADAIAFAAYHGPSKATLSTPHLYLSSLATFPRHSAMVQCWRQQLGGIPRFIGAKGVGTETLVARLTLESRVTTLSLSPDGVNVAIGSPDGLVKIWDLSTGEEVKVLKGHTRLVQAVAYSPDGAHVASGSDDTSVRVWDVLTGQEAKVLEGHTSSVFTVAYSPDLTHIVSGSNDHSVRVWDLSTGQVKVLSGHTRRVRAVAYSPNGTHVVSASWDHSVRVWNVSTGVEVRTLKGHTSLVQAVAYSPDGTQVVSGSDDKSVRVWDVVRGQEVRILKGHTNCICAVAYSSDSSHVVSGSDDKSVRVWHVATGKERILNGHASGVQAVAYLPDGTHVVSGSSDKSVRVWDVSRRQDVRTLTGKGHTDWVRAVAYSPDQTHVVSGSSDKSVRIWDVSRGREVRTLMGHIDRVRAVAYSPDGTHVVSGSDDKSVHVWDVSTGKERGVLNGHTSGVYAVTYSLDGTHVVSGSSDKSVRVWDISTGWEVRTLKGHTNVVLAVAYSPDGTHVVSGSGDKSVRVWDVSTGEERRILKGHTDDVNAVAYSPDGTHVVSGSSDNSVGVWNVSTGKEVRVIVGHNSKVWAVAYSPDGALVVFASSDNSIRVWDVCTGQEVRVLNGNTAWVFPVAVAYSSDGTHVVSGSTDQLVRVWNVSSKHTPRYVRQQGLDGEYTGWLLSPTDPSAYLMFVQPEAALPDDANILTLPTSAVPHLDFSTAKFGERWAECYTPQSF